MEFIKANFWVFLENYPSTALTPGIAKMIGKLISAVDALVYTFLAFIVPFYWTCKALLRQFTHSETLSASKKTTSLVETNQEEDESIVPTTANEEEDIEFTTIPASFTSLQKPTAATSAASNQPQIQASTVNGNQSFLVNWLYYWALLSVFHVCTRLYELIVIPLLGNSMLYRFGKLGVLLWLNHDASGAPARLAWNSVIGPLVSKYESDIDALVAAAQFKARSAVLSCYSAAREFVQSKFILSEDVSANTATEAEVKKND